MRFLISALGSYGDVHPMLGLGSALSQRGHQVSVITNPHFQPLVESVPLDFIPLGTAEQYDQLAHHPDLWNPLRGPKLVMRTAMADSLRDLYRIVHEQVVPGETVLVAHCLDLASRIHQEKYGTPMASVHFAPVGLRSFYESPQMYWMLMQSWLPRWFRRFQYWLADKVVDQVVCPELNGLCGELGLPPVRRVMHQWYFSPQLVLGLFPEWFAPAQPDWPPHTQLTGFPLWDQSETVPLPQELEQFLQAGDPPLVFAPGSAMTKGAWFFQAAVEACEKLNRRGILLTKYPRQLPARLPSGVAHFEFVPFSTLLPRSAALVHHGGIGTCSQGLAAGVPQVVMPMAYDQLDNATRLTRLGVATILPKPRFTGINLASALKSLLENSTVRQHCFHWAQQFDTPFTMETTCRALEELLPK